MQHTLTLCDNNNMANIAGLLEKYKTIEGERFFQELFEAKEYEPLLERKADVVLDVGACAGEFAAYIYDKAGKIYCFEPFSKHYEELEENVKEFELDKIRPYRLAIGDIKGLARLTTNDFRGGNKLTEAIENTELVPVTTLKQFLLNNNIDHVDILKIDIEGGEYKVFTAKEFAEVAPKIDVIIGEHLNNVNDVLTSLGYKVVHLKDNRNVLYER